MPYAFQVGVIRRQVPVQTFRHFRGSQLKETPCMIWSNFPECPGWWRKRFLGLFQSSDGCQMWEFSQQRTFRQIWKESSTSNVEFFVRLLTHGVFFKEMMFSLCLTQNWELVVVFWCGWMWNSEKRNFFYGQSELGGLLQQFVKMFPFPFEGDTDVRHC